MALNTFKCNHLMPLHFKGLTHTACRLLHLDRSNKCIHTNSISVAQQTTISSLLTCAIMLQIGPS